MSLPTADAHARERAALAARKRRLYTVGAIAGVVVLALSWVAREPDDVIVTVVYPALGLALVALTLALLRRWLSLEGFERIALTAVGIVVLGRLAWHLHLAGPIDEHLLVLVGGHYWAVAALIVGGFVLLDRRTGLLLGCGVLLASVVLVVTGAGPELFGEDGDRVALLYLARVHGFLVVLLALTLAVATLREQLDRSMARAQAFEELAVTDPLTGLVNRRGGEGTLDHEVEAARRYGRELSVVAIDIDRFKEVNDTYGHQRGDEVLRVVGQLLQQQARDADLVVRWGGEEFLLIAPETNQQQATQLAERCRAAIARARPTGLDVTATFGVTQFSPDEDDLDRLLARADALLYDAKERGRDQVLGASNDAPAG